MSIAQAEREGSTRVCASAVVLLLSGLGLGPGFDLSISALLPWLLLVTHRVYVQPRSVFKEIAVLSIKGQRRIPAMLVLYLAHEMQHFLPAL